MNKELEGYKDISLKQLSELVDKGRVVFEGLKIIDKPVEGSNFKVKARRTDIEITNRLTNKKTYLDYD